MSPTAVPTRITIDFRDAVHPSRTWILGVDEGAPARVELITFETPTDASASRSMAPRLRTIGSLGSPPHPTVLAAECACPEFCELDHANE